MKKDWNEIQLFLKVANHYIETYNGEDTLMIRALTKVTPQIDEINKKRLNEIEKIKLNNCLTDEKGVIQYDKTEEGGKIKKEYMYTKQDRLKMYEELEKLDEDYMNKEFQIEPFIINKFPEDVPSSHIEIMRGFIAEEMLQEAE